MKSPKMHQNKKLIVKRLTVYLAPQLEKQVRALAEKEDRTLSNIAERAFRAYITTASIHNGA